MNEHYDNKQSAWTCIKWGCIGIAIATLLILVIEAL